MKSIKLAWLRRDGILPVRKYDKISYLDMSEARLIRKFPMEVIFVLIAVFFVALIPTLAQDTYVSDNEVNAVAKEMYCPVCENIPLDACQTATCIEWKEEIRTQLAQGESSDDIINSFVTRFGDHVVGTPQDPILRALTIIMPIIGALLAIMVGIMTFRRFGANQKLTLENEISDNPSDDSDEAYRQRLEQDLLARR